jgi:hypothetical protein
VKQVPQPFQALTVTANNGLLRSLKSECGVCAAFDPTQVPREQRPKLEKFMAIWDTGATNSVITQKVVDSCGLKPVGMKETHGVHGKADVETFLINVMLPNSVGFVNLEVTLGQLYGADVLLGMDIITSGDFSITNVGGRTVFSFRVPSITAVDFVKEFRRNAALVAGVKPKFQPGPPSHKRRR